MTFDKRVNSDRHLIEQTLGILIPHGTTCALIGYPDHWNTGDMAIWQGTRHALRKLGVRVRYVCDPWSYSPENLAKALPYGPILLQGGGNFGDVYFDELMLRERIFRDFPARRIIQLPQSIWFKDHAHSVAIRERLTKLSDFTLMVRDQTSAHFARDHLQVDPVLCPDLALALSRLSRAHPPAYDVYALWRDDVEAAERIDRNRAPDLTQDWAVTGDNEKPLSPVTRWMYALIPPPVHGDYSFSAKRNALWRWCPAFWNRLAQERVNRGARMLQQGHVVITNRLHAHILCVLLGLPHVVCDTNNEKISNYRRSWPIDDTRLAWADGPADAVDKARDLIRRTESNG